MASTVSIVGAISAKGVLRGEPPVLMVAKMRGDDLVFYLTNLREITVKSRKTKEESTVYEGDVLNIDGVKVGTVRLDTPGLMDDVDALVTHGAEVSGVDEDEAANFTYGPLRVTRERRVYHLADAEQ